MKAIVSPVLMKKALKQIGPVIGSNQIIAALGCLKMDFNKKELTIIGSNLKNQVIVETDCESKSPFSLLMPVDKFTNICDKADGPIVIELTKDGIKLSDDNSKFNLPLNGDPENFPMMKTDDEIITYQADGDFFYSVKGANDCGCKSNSMEDACIANALIDFKKDGIVIFGTDRQVLYNKKIEFKTDTPISAHITENFVSLTKEFQESEVIIGKTFITAKHKNVTVTSRLSDYRFVDYNVMNPKNEIVWNVLVNRKDLIKHIEKIGCACDQKNKDILFTFNDPVSITLDAFDSAYGVSGNTYLSASQSVKKTEHPIRLSGSKLLSLLNSLGDTDIRMSFTDNKSFVYLSPEAESDKTLIYISPIAVI